MTKRPPLFFWHCTPPAVGRGAFDSIAKLWGNSVAHICQGDFGEDRESVGWNSRDFVSARILILDESSENEAELAALVDSHADAVHVFLGFDPRYLRQLREHYTASTRPRIVVMAERPGVYGPEPQRTLKRILQPKRSRYIRVRWNGTTAAYLPLGQLGVSAALRAGWPAHKVYPFMYCPELFPQTESAADPQPKGGPVRLLYVGRFSRYTKGIDTLMRAVEHLPADGWSIDFVGGYGEYTKQTIAWTQEDSKRRYLGSWPPQEVGARMTNYDVCVVPSRFDGWNVLINQALNAKIGVITTDQAVSHELVEASGAGLVVPAEDPILLAEALTSAITDPTLAQSWASLAESYVARISPDAVANYFLEILDFTFGFQSVASRPQCPWIEECQQESHSR